MKRKQEEKLNYFFVNTFNQILSWEERALQKSGIQNLSVKEVHIIEATKALEMEEKNTMTHIAKRLDISVGALTTAVNTLVKKEYLKRASDKNDRRIVKIELTESGEEVYQRHQIFHKEMIQEVLTVLDEDSVETLTDSLQKLSEFFQEYRK